MFKITWLEDADAKYIEILIDTNFDRSVLEDLRTIEHDLEQSPRSVGHARSSSVHRMGTRGRLLIDFEVIIDDLRVLIHDITLLPLP